MSSEKINDFQKVLKTDIPHTNEMEFSNNDSKEHEHAFNAPNKTIKILDMSSIRHLNLFSKITRIRANHCFEYNNTIIFVVPRRLVLKAIGRDNKNLEDLSRFINKKIKIVAYPNGIEDLQNFVSLIIRPIKLKAVEIKDNEAIICANPQNKASLIGKGKIRLEEMGNILNQYFGIKRVRIK